MLGMLQVVIGLIFVLLLLSLLATTMMELIAAAFRLRGKNLERALRNILACTTRDNEVMEKFKSNALYKQLSYKYSKEAPPSYLEDDTFQSILFSVILDGKGMADLKQQIDDMPDDELKEVLLQLYQEAEANVDVFKLKVKKWYNDVMDRASGWYKVYTQQILLGVGFFIAVAFNADTIAIYQRLESDPETLQAVVDLAEDYANGNVDNTAATAARNTSPEFEEALANLEGLVNNQIEAVKSPLGMGWQNIAWETLTPYDVFIRFLGWVVTALAISLGAPFWFDLLRKLVNIRNAGKKPEST